MMASINTKEMVKIIAQCRQKANEQGGNWWQYASDFSGYMEGLPLSKLTMEDDESNETELELILAISELIYKVENIADLK